MRVATRNRTRSPRSSTGQRRVAGASSRNTGWCADPAQAGATQGAAPGRQDSSRHRRGVMIEGDDKSRLQHDRPPFVLRHRGERITPSA
jgi:hypothetical protein